LVVVGNEQCDDGNLTNGDGCDQNCTPTGCENGISFDGELCFDKNDDLVGPGTPEQARGGDFDQDGRPDLVARYAITDPNTQGFSVRLFLNEESGRFGSFVDLPLLDEPRHVATGDLNGDGAPEIVVLQESGGLSSTVIFINNRDGSFTRQNGPIIENGTTAAFELADLTGDGVLDLVSANVERRSVSVRRGNGNGAFNFLIAENFVLPQDVTPRVVLAAEIDGAPGLDLVLLNDTVGVLAEPFRVVFLLNDGVGVLRDVPGPRLDIAPSALFVTQLDEQAGLDLAFAIQSGRVEDNGILTFTNKGAGVFTKVGTFAVQGNLTSITAADFDGDGDQDLAATDFGGAKVKVLVNNGAGQLDTPREVETGELETRLSPVSLFSDEFNGDGVADLIVTGKNIGLLFSNP
jgi:cysteine-rich repeat protein